MQRRLGLDLEVSRDFGAGLAWYTAAEAYFAANILRKDAKKRLILRYGIKLRADDKPALEYIQSILGVGGVRIEKPSGLGSNPMARYEVHRTADLYHVILPLFEKYPIPPQFRKARDFEIWKQLVRIQYQEGGHRSLGRAPGGKCLGTAALPQSYWNKVEPLVEQLKLGRKFAGNELLDLEEG